MDRRTLPLAEQIAAAQAWWREAGVDLAFSDEPQGWLAEPAVEEPVRPTSPSKAALQAEPEPRNIGGDPSNWPQDLAAFHRWWLEEPSLDRGDTRPRIAPRGPQGAPIAVLVPMPEAEDADTLLSGAQGRLVASMLQAMGLDPETAYLGAALPRHEAVPDWPSLGRDGLGEVLRHHLALAAPERLIVLGRDVSPLLQHDWTQPAPAFDEIAIQTRKLPVMTSFSPARLLEQPGLRKRLWQQWLEWSERDMG
jgi:DNA polymerase